MIRLIKSYVKEEDAISMSVETILFIVIGIAVVLAVGYFIYNLVAGQAQSATENLEQSTNPGAGNEFSANSFF